MAMGGTVCVALQRRLLEVISVILAAVFASLKPEVNLREPQLATA
jgi:hypothetical protein